MLLHAGTNIVFDFFPRTSVIFSSADLDFNVFKAIAYWLVALIIIVITKGKLVRNIEYLDRNRSIL
jgi:hypothetical protein